MRRQVERPHRLGPLQASFHMQHARVAQRVDLGIGVAVLRQDITSVFVEFRWRTAGAVPTSPGFVYKSHGERKVSRQNPPARDDFFIPDPPSQNLFLPGL